MVLDILSVPRHPTDLDNSMAEEYWACSRCGWGLFGQFSLVCLLSPSLWETARNRLKYCLYKPLGLKTSNQFKMHAVKNNIQMHFVMLPAEILMFMSCHENRLCIKFCHVSKIVRRYYIWNNAVTLLLIHL